MVNNYCLNCGYEVADRIIDEKGKEYTFCKRCGSSCTKFYNRTYAFVFNGSRIVHCHGMKKKDVIPFKDFVKKNAKNLDIAYMTYKYNKKWILQDLLNNKKSTIENDEIIQLE